MGVIISIIRNFRPITGRVDHEGRRYSAAESIIAGLLLEGGSVVLQFLFKIFNNVFKNNRHDRQHLEPGSHIFYDSSQPGCWNEDPNGTSQDHEATSSEEESENEEESIMCAVCKCRPRQTIIEPCSHVLLCKSCAKQIVESTKECPECKREISKIKSSNDNEHTVVYVT